jgi:hypothetical protein
MKRTLIVLVALLAMVAFVVGAVAQEKKAPAAPAAEKAKAEKPKAPKATNFKGTIVAYEAGKMIKVKGAKEKEMTFGIAADAKIKGEAKEGAKVTVGYKKDGDKMVATSILVAAAKKAKKEMKEEKKK